MFFFRNLIGLVWFGRFYGISTFVGYLMSNPFLCKLSVLFKTIQFSISTQFNCQKHFYFKLFNLFKQLYKKIQFSVSTVSMSKTVQFHTIQFSINTVCQKHFNFKLFKQLYVTIHLGVNTVLMSKNSSISNNSVKHKHAV